MPLLPPTCAGAVRRNSFGDILIEIEIELQEFFLFLDWFLNLLKESVLLLKRR